MRSFEDVVRVFATGLDDDGHLWFGVEYSDGRLASVCYETGEEVFHEIDTPSGV
jgi:hypothetical protein